MTMASLVYATLSPSKLNQNLQVLVLKRVGLASQQAPNGLNESRSPDWEALAEGRHR